jgi:hypothetical protein
MGHMPPSRSLLSELMTAGWCPPLPGAPQGCQWHSHSHCPIGNAHCLLMTVIMLVGLKHH